MPDLPCDPITAREDFATALMLALSLVMNATQKAYRQGVLELPDLQFVGDSVNDLCHIADRVDESRRLHQAFVEIVDGLEAA